jgi:hypothetical protein
VTLDASQARNGTEREQSMSERVAVLAGAGIESGPEPAACWECWRRL